MVLTVVLGFVAGFFAGNGIPYYIAGSTGSGVNPSPFRQTPTTSVVVGWIALVTAGVAWAFTDTRAHPLPTYAAAAVGVLAVGLIHARNWGTDPWHRHHAAAPDGFGTMRQSLDEQGVRDACMRYWAGVDQKDAGLFGAAFTADAELSLLGGERVVKIADMIAEGRLGGDYAHTCHSPASQTVTVTGDTATAISFAVADLIPEAGPVLVRGLRYRDQLVRDGSGWRITRREHDTLWQYDAESVVPHLPGEPVTKAGPQR